MVQIVPFLSLSGRNCDRILDDVKDEDGDGAANVTDVELFLKRNKAARKALNGNDNYPGGDFRSPECVALLKEADIVVTSFA